MPPAVEPTDTAVRRLRRRLGLPAPPWIVGHRGATAEAVENTLGSFRRAVEQGADMVEADVQLTADGGLAVLHDADLRRLAGVDGDAEATELARLLELELTDAAGRRGRIPSLAELLAELPEGMPLNLELKRRRADRGAFATAIAAAVAGRGRILVSSFDHRLLARLAARAPGLPLAPLAKRWPHRLLAAGRRLDAAALHCHHRLAHRVLRHPRGGRPVLVYTVNDAATARVLLASGAAGLFSDRPGALRAELEGAAGSPC